MNDHLERNIWITAFGVIHRKKADLIELPAYASVGSKNASCRTPTNYYNSQQKALQGVYLSAEQLKKHAA
jgi:hypothetical protein